MESTSFMLQIPSTFPQPGFYYHYKHTPEKGVRDYAYFIAGVGFHTEDDCRPQDANMGVYQPLYESAAVYQAHLTMGVPTFDLRPLAMLMETVEVNGQTVPRFQKITDTNMIAQLAVFQKEMWG